MGTPRQTQLAITWTNFTIGESTHRHHQQPIMVHLHEAKAWDIASFIFSLASLLFSGVVVCYSIVEQKTSMWKEVPGWASLLIFIFVLWLLGVMEGLQIALVELKRQNPETYKETYPTAYRLGQQASMGDNIEKFLMGRQVNSIKCHIIIVIKIRITIKYGHVSNNRN